MIQCTKKIEFDAAHRIIGHDNGCQMVHGHRYIVETTFKSTEVDAMGMVIDFQIIKKRFKGWIDDNWDHNIILHVDDKKLGDMIEGYTNQKVFYMQYNPTAENIAMYLHREVLPKIFSDSPSYIRTCTKIKVRETPTSSASYELI
jgi:6-pyruvoyltetrahydropterin/6-carboxytetrahydropterin synthase